MMTNEMKQWLGANMLHYEQILVHAFLHDVESRSMLTNSNLTHEAFSDARTGLLYAAASFGAKMRTQMGLPFPESPSEDFLRTNAAAANSKDPIVTPPEMEEAIAMGIPLLDPARHKDNWHAVASYFEAWYGTSTMKRLARKLQASRVILPGDVSRQFQAAATQAAGVFVQSQDDLDAALQDDDEEQLELFQTGFYQLDDALGGGMGLGECGIVFGGTGAGKSVVVSQMSGFQLRNLTHVHVISTEMSATKYLARMVANRCNINVQKFRQCRNFKQIKQVVASGFSSKCELLDQFEHELERYFGFTKLDPDNTLSIRGVLDNELMRYEKRRGCPPKVMFFDWIGRMADTKVTKSTGDRSAEWERAADEFVKFCEARQVSMVLAAQAVNGSEKLRILTMGDIGVGKGIGKPMSWVAGITNTADMDAVRTASSGRGDMPDDLTKDDQFLCPAKTRNAGSGPPIPVSRRNLKYQRFEAAPPK